MHSEISDRFAEFNGGNPDALSVPGQLISMALAIWGASFSVNEKGHEYLQETRDPRQRVNDINDMLREMLYLIDIHGILRMPSWDGVRLILLILPLTHGENPHPLRLILLIVPQKSKHLPRGWSVSLIHSRFEPTTDTLSR